MHIEIQNCFSFCGTSSPRPPTGASPLDPTGGILSPDPLHMTSPHILYQVCAPGRWNVIISLVEWLTVHTPSLNELYRLLCIAASYRSKDLLSDWKVLISPVLDSIFFLVIHVIPLPPHFRYSSLHALSSYPTPPLPYALRYPLNCFSKMYLKNFFGYGKFSSVSEVPLKLKLKLKPVYLHHSYITMKIIGINYYMLQKRDPRSNCF